MKKISYLSIFITTLFLIGCNERKFALQTYQLASDLNIMICTKGNSTACDSKDRVYLKNLTLTNYSAKVGPNRFILQVTGGSNHLGDYIGIESSQWDSFYAATAGLDAPAREVELRNFFQANFDAFRFLDHQVIVDSKGNPQDNFYWKNGAAWEQFSEASDASKDLESIGANIERVNTERLEDILNINYGLSAERAQAVAKNISDYQKLSSKRSLTEKESNFFSNELLGVNYKEAQTALSATNSEKLNDLIEKAAVKNATSPEQISAILIDFFI